jgi:hypothetical protein
MSQTEARAVYRLSEDEYVRANRLYSRPSRRVWVYYSAGVAALALLAILAPWEIVRFASIFAIAGGVVGHLASRYVVAPWQTRRQYRSYPAAQEQLEAELDADGVRFRTDQADALVKWSHVIKWREDEEFVLIYQNPRLYHILPKSLARNGFDINELVAALKRNIGSAT